MKNEGKLAEFGSVITRLIRKVNITKGEAKECWRQILENEQPDIQQGAFMAALISKGETFEEIAGSWEAIYEFDTIKAEINTPKPLTENTGTGMDTLKTFNISTAAAIVAAACGVYIVKHGARAITSKVGTVDVLEKLGVGIENDFDLVKKSVEEVGIGSFSAFNAHSKLSRFLPQIRFPTTLNIAASLANPVLPTYGVRGVYSLDIMDIVIKTMKEIGYRRAFVMCGINADKSACIDEVSTLGPTIVKELKEDGRIEDYTISPEDFDIKRASYEDIASTADVEQEVLVLLRVLTDKDKGPKKDIVCLNTAPILYISGECKTLQEGLKMATNAITDGKAYQKLRDWVSCQNNKPEIGLKKLDELVEKV